MNSFGRVVRVSCFCCCWVPNPSIPFVSLSFIICFCQAELHPGKNWIRLTCRPAAFETALYNDCRFWTRWLVADVFAIAFCSCCRSRRWVVNQSTQPFPYSTGEPTCEHVAFPLYGESGSVSTRAQHSLPVVTNIRLKRTNRYMMATGTGSHFSLPNYSIATKAAEDNESEEAVMRPVLEESSFHQSTLVPPRFARTLLVRSRGRERVNSLASTAGIGRCDSDGSTPPNRTLQLSFHGATPKTTQKSLFSPLTGCTMMNTAPMSHPKVPRDDPCCKEESRSSWGVLG